jgi:hypothetical protein
VYAGDVVPCAAGDTSVIAIAAKRVKGNGSALAPGEAFWLTPCRGSAIVATTMVSAADAPGTTLPATNVSSYRWWFGFRAREAPDLA